MQFDDVRTVTEYKFLLVVELLVAKCVYLKRTSHRCHEQRKIWKVAPCCMWRCRWSMARRTRRQTSLPTTVLRDDELNDVHQLAI